MRLRFRYLLSLILLVVFSSVLCVAAKLTIGISSQREISVVIDSAFHSDFGLAYPVTFKIAIPPAQHNLRAYTRHTAGAAWKILSEKTSSDFFNGIEAVRFDYANGIAYVSAAFDPGGDLLMIRIVDNASRPIQITYQGICPYYDNRVAAVVVSLDDWTTSTLPDFQRAITLFRSYHLQMTIAIITGGLGDNATRQEIQNQINVGDIEPASHTRTHPQWPNYIDVTSEIAGSKTDLLDNLTFPPLYRKGAREYVYSWIAPYGETNSTLEAAVTSAKYLNTRVTGTILAGDFKAWDPARKRYNPDGKSIEVGPVWGTTSQPELDAAFNVALSGGKIYHLICHPYTMTANGQWDQPYLAGHLATISNRKNVWYTSFGHLYLYHLLSDPATGRTVVINGPATITLDPANQTIIEGQTATFSISAGGTAPLRYQWQKNGVPIVAATDSSYTTPAATRGEDGATYRCIVSNGLGSVTSNAATLTVTAKPAPWGVTSDDFSSPTLNTALWTFVNPLGDATVSMTGTGRLSITVPAGVSHDLWTGTNSAPRIVQAFNNTDFEVELKVDAAITSEYQAQGIVAAENTQNFVRMDFIGDAAKTRFFAASFVGGVPTLHKDSTITRGTPLYLRVKRAGNVWTGSFSYDGSTWFTAATFSHTLAVASVGPFTANAGVSPPAFTALFDYFRSTDYLLSTESQVVHGPALPTEFSLGRNYPNPFNPATTIVYGLPEPATVSLKIYSMIGQEVATLVNADQAAGEFRVVWDGHTARGTPPSSGVYIYRLTATGISGKYFVSAGRMMLLK